MAQIPSWSIRDCRPEEADAVLSLWRAADATPSATDNSESLRGAILNSPAVVLVAEQGGQIIGSIIGSFDGWRANLYRLAVHPDHRRRGIARALVHEVEMRLVAQGAQRITALVEKNHPLPMGFWPAAGYEQDHRMVRFTHNVRNER